MKYVIVLIIFFVSLGASANSAPSHRHIVVTGKATVSAIPDIVKVKLMVEHKAKLSLSAKAEVDQRVNRFLEGLQKFSISEDNVSASTIQIAPQTHYPPNGEAQIIGYRASRHLSVTLNNIQSLSEFIDYALANNINQVQQISYLSSKQNELKTKAMQQALSNAKQQAAEIAQASGLNLGHVYSVNIVDQRQQFRYGANAAVEQHAMADEVSSSGRYLTEELNFNARVNVVYDLVVQ